MTNQVSGIRSLVALLLCAGAGLLAGCGGGGGGAVVPVPLPPPIPVAPPEPPPLRDGEVSGRFEPAVVRVSGISRQPTETPARVRVFLAYTGERETFIKYEHSGRLLSSIQGGGPGQDFDLDLLFLPASQAGTEQGQLVLRVCFDLACNSEVQGSPLRVPLERHALPNVEVPADLSLARTGRQPAPSMEWPVSVPEAAGELTLTSSPGSGSDGIQLSWNGTALRAETTQLRAGRYEAPFVLSSRSQPVYRIESKVVYTVHPPPEGELGLSVAPPVTIASVRQGESLTHRLRVQRPTWTDAFAQTFSSTHPELTLHDVGGDEYEMRLDTRGLPVGTELEGRLDLSAGPTGGLAQGRLRVTVTDSFRVGGGLSEALRVDSTAEALRLSAAVEVEDGEPARWTARSLTAGLSLGRSSGIAGVDPLQVVFDPAWVLSGPGGYLAQVEVTLDRPGVLPITAQAYLENRLPLLNAALQGPLLPGRNLLFVDVANFNEIPFRDFLEASGATLSAASLPADTRYVGDVVVLQLELEGAVAGQDVELRMPNAFTNVPLRLPVMAPPRLLTAHAHLPRAHWRSPHFSLRHGALYFSAPGEVARWAAGPSGWTLQRASLPGVEDMLVFGDETRLIALGGTQAWRLDPLSLALVDQAPLQQRETLHRVDPRVPRAMGAAAVAADGAVLVAAGSAASGDPDWVSAVELGLALRPLTGVRASPGGPGRSILANIVSGEPALGFVRSTSGTAVVGQVAGGRTLLYRATARRPVLSQTLPDGRWVRAVSDDGERVLDSDGRLWLSGEVLEGSLLSLVPTELEVGGLGLTGDGRWALLYAYRTAAEASGPRARDAAVWVIDLSAVHYASVAPARVAARLPLPDAVGCTGALEPGEPCTHAATVVSAPGNGHAFVLGPRGVAVVPLEGAAAASSSRGPNTAQPLRWLPRDPPPPGRR